MLWNKKKEEKEQKRVEKAISQVAWRSKKQPKKIKTFKEKLTGLDKGKTKVLPKK